MGIMLGNLTIRDIENRLGIILNDEDRKTLDDMRQDKAANIAPGKWHCFDMPFDMVCGDYDTASKINDILSPYSDKMICALRICIDG